MPRFSVIAETEEFAEGEAKSLFRWLDENKDAMSNLTDDLGAGGGIHMFEFDAPDELVASLPPAIGCSRAG